MLFAHYILNSHNTKIINNNTEYITHIIVLLIYIYINIIIQTIYYRDIEIKILSKDCLLLSFLLFDFRGLFARIFVLGIVLYYRGGDNAK